MIVKRYVVQEMPEAIAKIRKDLGKNAIIISTKKIKTRGFLGFFGRTAFEVIAAAEEEEKKANDHFKGGQAFTESVQEEAIRMKKPEAFSARGGTERHEEGQVEPEKERLLQEVQQLRSMFQSFLLAEPSGVPAVARRMQKTLLANGVDESFALRLIHKGMQHIDDIENMSEQAFREVVQAIIQNEMGGRLAPSPITGDSRVVSIIGPTGVGKTTTIAKLAAHQVLHERKKVGLITSDTYRIAAVEQLKTYADILNIPLEIVYTPDDCVQALQKFSEKDLILMDTAGRNYTQKMPVAELHPLLHAIDPDEIYLVLSLTSKTSDLETIIANFCEIKIDKLLFTKLDETSTYGAMYNLVQKFQLPASYATTGQNVPDDIEVLTPESIAKLIVGENQYV
ncbi:flagellar biosynthesis regulator FlhF [Collibacillus ludicampi]|uniref:Flagellar biosynthesis protein FlhF n=1 Tax=Collibacillus ludicampi TaxID=2771369 RepID=A0AAV4LJL0_9BACL|nr:flagellar biosynthesis protein FlhF [Collibacillus ludicampi]GIM47818.1 flagellar biosynthesis regulator FlhF [Collibacillus ludicampi]